GSSNTTSTGILPSAASGGANHTGAHGEFAPARVSSHGLIWSGEKCTLPAPRYTNQDTCNPRFLPTVTRVGGSIAGLIRAAGVGADVAPGVAAAAAPRPLAPSPAGAPALLAARRRAAIAAVNS